MQIFLIIYSYFFFYYLLTNNYIYFSGIVLIGIAAIIYLKILKNISIKKTKKIVKELLEDNKKEIKPFINVNRANWYIFQELPGFTRVSAKKVIWIKRHNGFYKSIEDFFIKNSINDENIKQILKKIIYI